MSAGQEARAGGFEPGRRQWGDPRAIRVLRLGTDVAARLETAPAEAGVIHSVFDRAVNILWHDGRLLTLHGPGPLLAPFAAGLERLPAPGSLGPAMPVRRGDRDIRLGRVTVGWRAATLVDTRVTPARGGAETLARVLRAAEIPAPAAGLGSRRGHEAQALVADGIRRGDSRALIRGARGLIGLGEGLTPAGDDCLIGVLAVLARFRPAMLRDDPAATAELAEQARTGTTIVGREFVLHALGGAFSEALADLVAAGSEADARRAVAQLLPLGATSGADTLAGMRLALGALAE
jgi:hypothetical protein